MTTKGGDLKEAQALVAEFHRKFGCTLGDSIAIRDADLRTDLILEEATEAVEAILDNKRADGKISKGPDYSPPDVAGELAKQGWKP